MFWFSNRCLYFFEAAKVSIALGFNSINCFNILNSEGIKVIFVWIDIIVKSMEDKPIQKKSIIQKTSKTVTDSSEQLLAQLLTQYSDRKMFKLIFKALRMSNDFQSKLSSEDLVFSETCIEISIPPKVSIKYLNKDIAKLTKIEAEFE